VLSHKILTKLKYYDEKKYVIILKNNLRRNNMKKIFLLVLCLILTAGAFGCKEEPQPVTEGTSTTEKTLEILKPEQEKFTEYTDLTDRFMEYCENGNLEGMYSLYYDDMLTKTYQRISDKVSKEEFDAGIKAEMESVYSYEEFEYGCPEMPAMSSPLSYVNQLMSYSGGDPLELTDDRVTNCVNLRVYKYDTAYPSDHMMACIDGYWYFVV